MEGPKTNNPAVMGYEVFLGLCFVLLFIGLSVAMIATTYDYRKNSDKSESQENRGSYQLEMF